MSAPHQITINRVGLNWSYSCREHTHTHPTDGLAGLCRIMVAAGLSGPAEMRDATGDLRLTTSHIERLAKRSLREDGKGMRYVKYAPFDASVFTR